jgi:hypothetical protein
MNSQKSEVVLLPRTFETRYYSLAALICGLIERDRSPAMPWEQRLVVDVCILVASSSPLPPELSTLPNNARNALVVGAGRLARAEEKPDRFDDWLDKNWRSLNHPEEFPLLEMWRRAGLRDVQAKTGTDQENHLSYLTDRMEWEQVITILQNLRKPGVLEGTMDLPEPPSQ